MANRPSWRAFVSMTYATLTTPAERANVFASSNERVYTLTELMEILDWDPFVRRWINFAQSRLSRHRSSAARYEHDPGDCVQDAIRLVLEGRRHFESGTQSEFFHYICDVIKSLISHDGEKTKRHGIAVSIASDAPEEEPTAQLNEARVASDQNVEYEVVFRDDLTRFLASLEPELARYAHLRAEHDDLQAIDFAAVLGTTVEEIRNMDRRLRRRREQWIRRPATEQRSSK